jgi:hypothetical protein
MHMKETKEYTLYNDTVMDHFLNPRNMGDVQEADGVGEVGAAACGDIMKISLKIRDGKIEDARFKTFGCGSAIASSSMATELIKGRTLEEAKNFPTRKSSTPWAACPRSRFIVPCWPRKRSRPPSKTTRPSSQPFPSPGEPPEKAEKGGLVGAFLPEFKHSPAKAE